MGSLKMDIPKISIQKPAFKNPPILPRHKALGLHPVDSCVVARLGSEPLSKIRARDRKAERQTDSDVFHSHNMSLKGSKRIICEMGK